MKKIQGIANCHQNALYRSVLHNTSRIALVAALMIPNVAVAQSQVDAKTRSGIEDIIVTAQKREQRLQSVPISINALSGMGAEQRGVETSDDLVSVVPALTWSKSYNGSPTIRGVGSALVASTESSVAIFVDSVLQISPFQANFALIDLERIEVLKGPQGTLFGRNANGGVISIFTRDPKLDQAELNVSAGYGNYNTIDGRLYGNVPISEQAAANLSIGYHNQQDGWGTNLTTGDDVYRNRSFDIRGKLRWEPTDRTDIILTGEYHDTYDMSATYRSAPGTIGADGTPAPGFYNSRNDWKSFVDSEIYGGNLRITHDLDFAKFVSITSYVNLDAFWSFDSDAVGTEILQGPIYYKANGFTQELQMVSQSGGNIRWIAGLFYMDNSVGAQPIELHGSAVGGATVEVFGKSRGRSIAPFGELTWQLTPSTNLTVGGRYTFDYRNIHGYISVNGGVGPTSYGSVHFSEPTYRVTLDHKLSDMFMIYGTVSTGYVSGQYNLGDAGAKPVKPETLQAYEIGFKSDIFDRHLQVNASAFWYDYKDLQVTTIQNAVTFQTNAAKARIKGIDLDISMAPVDDLTIQLSGSYVDAKYRDYPSAEFYSPLPGGGYVTFNGDATGNRLSNAPKYSASASVQYRIKSAFGSLLPVVNYSYRSKRFWNYQNDFVEPASNELNASLTYSPSSEHYDVKLWAKNILRDRINASGVSRLEGYFNAPAAPRTYGVTVGLHL